MWGRLTANAAGGGTRSSRTRPYAPSAATPLGKPAEQVGEEAANALVAADAAGGCVDEYDTPAAIANRLPPPRPTRAATLWVGPGGGGRGGRAGEGNGCRYLQDQLIILMALAAGESRVLSGPLTLHTQTAIHIAQRVAGVRVCASALGPRIAAGRS